jgi:hypothetical protein
MSQSSTQEQIGTRGNPELIWMGSGGWVAYDTSLRENDPRRVLAYLQCRDQRVDVTWVRGNRGEERFDSVRAALEAVRGV